MPTEYRTETTVKQFKDDELTKETTSVVTTIVPDPDPDEHTGPYL